MDETVSTENPLLAPDEVEELDGWLTLSDVAEVLGISRQALHKQIFAPSGVPLPARQRLLKTVRKVGRSERPPYVFRTEEVEQLLQRRDSRTTSPD